MKSLFVAPRIRFLYRSVIALLGISSSIGSLSSHALAPPTHISQYGHTAWRLEDGFFQSSPQTIAQTADGYLWFGTPTGPLKFDGIRFTKLLIPVDQKVSGNVVSLLGSSDGSLWLGTAGGLARSYQGTLTLFPKLTGQIDGIIEDHNHKIWVARARAGIHAGSLCEVKGASTLCHGEEEGIAKPYAVALAEAADHSLWVAHSSSLSHWSGDRATTLPVSGLDQLNGLSGIRVVLGNDDGSMWFGLSSVGVGLGLQRERNGKLSPLQIAGFDSQNIIASALLHTRDGALWVGTDSDGIYRIKDGQPDHYRRADGLTSDAVYNLFEDREGNVWVATSSGVDRFRSLRVTTFSLRDGLSAGNPRSILAARDGTVWVGNQGALDAIRGTQIRSIRESNGLPGQKISSIAEDRHGLLWVGVDNSLVNYDGKTFSKVVGDAGIALGIIRSIVQDAHSEDMYALAIRDSHEHLLCIRDRHVAYDIGGPESQYAMSLAVDPAGGVFVSTLGASLRQWRGDRLQPIQAGTSLESANSMFVDSDGTLWGASSRGLIGLKGGHRTTLDQKSGLPCDAVDKAIEDKRGDLWLHMPCGLVVISRAEVRKFWAESAHRVDFRTLTVLDGYFSGKTAFAPTISLANDGRIWSVNGQVAQVVDPASLTLNNFRPPVHIEQIVADRTSYPTTSGVTLPALTHNLEIDYTGLSFSVPQNLKFRYRLDGLEQAWQDAGNRRQAFYTNLRPGTYTFQVLASNSDGVWSKEGDSIAFVVAPAFYQTAWFAALMIALCLVLLYLIYLARIRIVTAQVHARMMERLSERERIARDLHDTFFQSIQGLLLKFNTGTSKLSQTDPARPIFVEALQESDQAMLEGRELLLDLRATTDTADLPVFFAQTGEELQKLHPTAFSISTTGEARPLHPLAATELYRIGKEALFNAFRHSGAACIEMELEYAPETMKIRIRDDGKGIDENIMEAGMRKGHWGLPGMHERASKVGGQLNVWSRKDNGTEIEITVPARKAYLANEATFVPAWMQRVIHKLLPPTGEPSA